MKDFFLRVKKRMTLPFCLITLLFGVNLFTAGKLNLIGAYLLGSVSALIYIFLQGQRIKSSEHKSKRAAKVNMFVGLVLRLLLVFIVLAAAAKIDTEVFFLATAGFLTFYVIFYLCSIVENLRK